MFFLFTIKSCSRGRSRPGLLYTVRKNCLSAAMWHGQEEDCRLPMILLRTKEKLFLFVFSIQHQNIIPPSIIVFSNGRSATMYVRKTTVRAIIIQTR